jgi:hypothetical protein
VQAREPRGTTRRPSPFDAIAFRGHRERGARTRDPPTADEHEGDIASAHRELQTKGGGEREPRRQLTEVERDQREARATDEDIGSAERGVAAALAAHPQ